MKYNKVEKAIFISRPNRFVANVLIDGVPTVAHVKNTGRCKELLVEGVTVYLEDFSGAEHNRKTNYSLIAVEKGNLLINMDSQAPNKAVGEALSSGLIILPEFPGEIIKLKAEKSYKSSRFDFFAEGHKKEAYIEVKGVTLEQDGHAMFPDAPTERGVKHINELILAKKDGYLSYIIFLIQMRGVKTFKPNDNTHPAFGEALRKASNEGVHILAFDSYVKPDILKVGDKIKVTL